MILDAPTGSFKGFYLDANGNCIYKFKEPTANIHKVKEVQRGIFEFIHQFKKIQNRLGLLATIKGRDAYAPMVNVKNEINRKYMCSIVNLMDDLNI